MEPCINFNEVIDDAGKFSTTGLGMVLAVHNIEIMRHYSEQTVDAVSL